MNAVMNLLVSFSGRTLLCEISFFTYAGNSDLASAYLRSGSCVSAGQSGLDTFFLYSQKVLKCAATNVIEFQRSSRYVLIKIHANIFVLKSSSVVKCFYCVSQLLLSDPSDLDSHLEFMKFVSVCELLFLNLNRMLVYTWLTLAVRYYAYKLL